jgi:hypothetical protein
MVKTSNVGFGFFIETTYLTIFIVIMQHVILILIRGDYFRFGLVFIKKKINQTEIFSI